MCFHACRAPRLPGNTLVVAYYYRYLQSCLRGNTLLLSPKSRDEHVHLQCNGLRCKGRRGGGWRGFVRRSSIQGNDAETKNSPTRNTLFGYLLLLLVQSPFSLNTNQLLLCLPPWPLCSHSRLRIVLFFLWKKRVFLFLASLVLSTQCSLFFSFGKKENNEIHDHLFGAASICACV